MYLNVNAINNLSVELTVKNTLTSHCAHQHALNGFMA